MSPTHYQTSLGDELGYELSPTRPRYGEKDLDAVQKQRGLSTISINFDLPQKIEFEVKSLKWVVGGDVNSYVSENLDREVKPPESFQALDDCEWDPYVGLVHGSMAGYGYGIGRTMMKAILRIITGDGHFDPGKITVLGCGTDPFIIDGPHGLLMGEPGRVTRPSDIKNLPIRPIETPEGTFETREGAQAIRAGLARVLSHLHRLTGSSPSSISRSPNAVFIDIADDRTVRIKHADLWSIGLSVCSQSDVTTDTEPLSLLESQPTGTRAGWEPTHAVGEKDEYRAVCVGYRVIRHGYESKGQLPEDKLPGIQSLYLTYVEDEHTTDRLILRRNIDQR